LRLDSSADQYSLFGWQLQALRIATKPDRAFDVEMMTDDWFTRLIGLSPAENGPSLVREHLAQIGISFVILPHLPKTYLDGAALLSSGGTPVVAMTLRHDRLDNFWFVLLHELAHVKLHLSKTSTFFDDCDVAGDGVEKEADAFAGEALLPSVKWEVSIARYLQSKDSIFALARELGIHPAIIAGRIRRETGKFIILTDLVGSGEVRRCFPEVSFAH
jgi:HTH-type transcriptional regulator/antitoxin HigA